MKKVITYGTFDTLHFGHIRLLERAKSLGDYLIVGLSWDEFNAGKGKTSHFNYAERKAFLEAIRDVVDHQIDIFTMGNDWVGKFDFLSAHCKVHYLSRTPAISSTLIKANITTSDKNRLSALRSHSHLVDVVL